MPEPDHFAQKILEQAPSCVWLVNKEGRFEKVYGDPSAIFGVPAANLTGRAVTQALSRHNAKTWIQRFARAFAGETIFLRHTAGNSIWNITVFPIRAGDEVTHVACMGRENSEWNKTEQQLRQTVLAALQSQEFERKMAAQFLHDNVGQNLTAFGLQLDLMRMDLEAEVPEIAGRIVEMQKLIEHVMEDVREYSYKLNPSTVERAGLRPALDRLASRMRERFSGAIRLNVDPSLKLDPKIAPAIFRIAQEAVENSVSHASCSTIEIAVKSTRSGITLQIKDNGRGFDPADLAGGRRGLGLLSMEHYAAQGGLELSISSDRQSGTTIRAVAAKPA